MDISGTGIAPLASGLENNDKVGVSVLKKAMDIEKDAATQLIEAIPEMPKSSPTGNKGMNVDIFA